MPLYQYSCEACGRRGERSAEAGKAPKTIPCVCKKRMKRCYGAAVASPGTWSGHLSEALACSPKHIEATQKEYYNLTGEVYKFAPDGRVHMESRQQRNKLLRALGMYDRDAGFGDPNGR